MPRMRVTRKPLYKKKRQYGVKRRYARRRLARAGGKQGGMFVVRKYQQITTGNYSGFSGSYQVGPPGITQNCLFLGTIMPSPLGGSLFDVPFALQFTLNDVVGVGEFTGLFDRYKITSAKIKVQTTLNVAQQNAVPVPFIDYITDHDDATPMDPTTFREKMGVKTKYFSASRPAITMGVKPVPAVQIYNSALSTAYGVPRRAPFINCSNPNVPHYGIKGIIRNLYLPTAETLEAGLTWDVSLGFVVRDIQ